MKMQLFLRQLLKGLHVAIWCLGYIGGICIYNYTANLSEHMLYKHIQPKKCTERSLIHTPLGKPQYAATNIQNTRPRHVKIVVSLSTEA